MLTKLLRKWLWLTVFFILSIIAFLTFLIGTNKGLHMTAWILHLGIPGQLRIADLEGRLLDEVQITKLYYHYQDRTITLENAHLKWEWNWRNLASVIFSPSCHPREGEDGKNGEMMTEVCNLNPLLRGTLTSKSLHLKEGTEDLQLSDFHSAFSGNSKETLILTAKGRGKYNQLPFESNLAWKEEKLNLTIQAENNRLKLQGNPSQKLTVQADLAKPWLLHPALEPLHIPIQIDGYYGKNQQGEFVTRISKGHLQLPQQNVHFSQADFKTLLKAGQIRTSGSLQFKDKTLNLNLILSQMKNWQVTATLLQDDHKLVLNGQGLLQPEISGQFNLSGKDFPLLQTSEYQIEASPDLKADFTKNGMNIQGTILIPKALIQPLSFEDGLSVSEDVSYVQSKTRSLPFNMAAHVNLVPGEEVFLNWQGLNTQLTGSLIVDKTAQGPITANGQLTLLHGKYKAYGQNLDIEQGQLIFTGGLLTKPGIQLKATRKFTSKVISDSNFSMGNIQGNHLGTTTTVGVSLSGWLSNPKIQLYANPATLSQADILSMLILGQPVNNANKAKAQLLMAALATMDRGKAASLLKKVKQKLDIELDLKTTSNFDKKTKTVTDSTALVIGKALTKKLYISYNAGLHQTDTNVFTLNWLLNRFLSVQVTASKTGNGIDILYSSNKESEHAEKTPVKSPETP